LNFHSPPFPSSLLSLPFSLSGRGVSPFAYHSSEAQLSFKTPLDCKYFYGYIQFSIRTLAEICPCGRGGEKKEKGKMKKENTLRLWRFGIQCLYL